MESPYCGERTRVCRDWRGRCTGAPARRNPPVARRTRSPARDRCARTGPCYPRARPACECSSATQPREMESTMVEILKAVLEDARNERGAEMVEWIVVV